MMMMNNTIWSTVPPLAVSIINFWIQTNSRWLLQLINIRKHKNGCKSVKWTEIELRCGVVAGSDPPHILKVHEVKLGQTSCKLSEMVEEFQMIPVWAGLFWPWELSGPFFTGNPSAAGLGQRLKEWHTRFSCWCFNPAVTSEPTQPRHRRVSRHWRNDRRVACWEFRRPHCEQFVLMDQGGFYVSVLFTPGSSQWVYFQRFISSRVVKCWHSVGIYNHLINRENIHKKKNNFLVSASVFLLFY